MAFSSWNGNVIELRGCKRLPKFCSTPVMKSSGARLASESPSSRSESLGCRHFFRVLSFRQCTARQFGSIEPECAIPGR